MSATSRGFIRAFTVSLSSSPPPPHSSNSTATVVSRFLGAGRRLLPLPPCFALSRSLRTAVSPRRDSDLAAVISSNKHKGQKKWKAKKNQNGSSMMEGTSSSTTDTIVEQLRELSISSTPVNEPSTTIQLGNVVQNQTSVPGLKTVWKPRSYGTSSVDVQSLPGNQINVGNQNDAATVTEKKSIDLSAAFRPDLLECFNVDNTTYSHAQIRATFYPKFENEKSDQEVRARMIEMVSRGLATLEVSLKHSGSLFMYAGHEGGAYAKNSFGNIYTAVGTFVLGRMLHESWGALASKKQADFNEFLENNRMCVSMELVTAVLGDHGQRPKEDYVVVTAVTELGHGKPRFYSTPEIIAFCREWRLPTNHVWLFSTRKSVTSFFAAFDALCEEGTATPVCKALDEVADISVPGSKDHIKSQGEILEGLVARIVSRESSKHMEDVLRNFSIAPVDRAGLELGPNLREICAANRSDEKQQVKAVLESVGSSFCPDTVDWFGKEADDRSRTADKSVLTKFLQAHPADYSTKKLQI